MDKLDVVLHSKSGQFEFDGRDTLRVQIQDSGAGWRDPDSVEKGHSQFNLQGAPPPLPIKVRIIPKNESHGSIYWSAEKEFIYKGNGVLATVSKTYDTENDDYVNTDYVSTADADRLFFAAQSFPNGGDMIVPLGVTVTKVRNVLPRAKKIIKDVPPYRRDRLRSDGYSIPEKCPPWDHPTPLDPNFVCSDYTPAWDLPPRAKLSVVGLPVVIPDPKNQSKRAVNIVDKSVAPRMVETVLEVRERKREMPKKGVVPQLFGVSVPETLLNVGTPTDRPSLPFHVHFRPYAAIGTYFAGPYPFNWDHIFYCLWSERTYVEDPLTRPKVGKGLCYQIACSGKKVALVLPCPYGYGFGKAVADPAWLEDMLAEIQAYYFRQLPIQPIQWSSDRPGWVSVSGLSGGNDAMASLLSKVVQKIEQKVEQKDGQEVRQEDPLQKSAIREVYLFDAPVGSIGNTLRTVKRWADKHPDFRVRAYSQTAESAYRGYLFEVSESESLVVDPNKGTRDEKPKMLTGTYVWVPTYKGETTFIKQDKEQDKEQDKSIHWVSDKVHQLVGALMLTDALRRSGLP